MKNLVLIFLFLLPLTIRAQKAVFIPRENDNVIVVTTDTVDINVLEKSASTLIDMGFTIETKNIKKGTLTTDPYDYDKGMLVVYLKMSLNEIKIYGVYEPNLGIVSGANKSKQFTKKIHYEEVGGGSVKKAWDVMDAYANQLAQSFQASVIYLKW